MPLNECIPYFEPSDRPSGYCTATVRGKRFVSISATIPGGPAGTENMRVAETGAGLNAVAVSGHDGAIGDTIPLIKGNMVVPMPAGVALTAGTQVQSDAQGRPIVLAGGVRLGICVSDQAVVDADVAIMLDL